METICEAHHYLVDEMSAANGPSLYVDVPPGSLPGAVEVVWSLDGEAHSTVVRLPSCGLG